MSPRRRKIVTDDDVIEATRAARLPDFTNGATPPPPPLTPSLVEERDDMELDAVLEQLGTEGRVKVWNISEGRSAFAGEMSMDGFTLDALMDTFGGGDKTLGFYQANRRVRSVRVALDPLVPPRNPRVKPPPPGAAVAPVAPGMDAASMMLAGMSAIMKASADNSTMMMAAMGEMLKNRHEAPPSNPLDAVKAVAEILKINAPPPSPPPLDLDKAFSLFEKGMSVANKLNGGGEEGDGTTSIIKEGIGAVGRMAEALIANRPLAGAPVAVVEPGTEQLELSPGPSAPSTAAVRPPGSAVTPSPSDMSKPLQPSRPWHRAVIAHYDDLKMAARFMSGDTAAVELLRRIPEPAPGEDDVLDDLLDDLEDETDPGFSMRTLVAFPELQLSPSWVQQFHETLKANMVEEVEEEDKNKARSTAPTIAPAAGPG